MNINKTENVKGSVCVNEELTHGTVGSERLMLSLNALFAKQGYQTDTLKYKIEYVIDMKKGGVDFEVVAPLSSISSVHIKKGSLTTEEQEAVYGLLEYVVGDSSRKVMTLEEFISFIAKTPRNIEISFKCVDKVSFNDAEVMGDNGLNFDDFEWYGIAKTKFFDSLGIVCGSYGSDFTAYSYYSDSDPSELHEAVIKALNDQCYDCNIENDVFIVDMLRL